MKTLECKSTLKEGTIALDDGTKYEVLDASTVKTSYGWILDAKPAKQAPSCKGCEFYRGGLYAGHLVDCIGGCTGYPNIIWVGR